MMDYLNPRLVTAMHPLYSLKMKVSLSFESIVFEQILFKGQMSPHLA